MLVLEPSDGCHRFKVQVDQPVSRYSSYSSERRVKCNFKRFISAVVLMLIERPLSIKISYQKNIYLLHIFRENNVKALTWRVSERYL